MKVGPVLVVCLGLAFAAPKDQKVLQQKSLIDDLLDILALIPIDEVKAILDKHLATDGALSEVIRYLQGPEWTTLVDEVGRKPEVQEFTKYLTDAGLPVDVIITLINELIQSAKPTAKPDANGILRPLLDEVEAVLSVEELVNLLNDKKVNSPEFADLYKKISSDKARQLVEEVRALEEVQRLASRLKDMGVKVDEALKVIYEWLGWGSPNLQKISLRSLITDLLEILALIPVEKVKTILDEHLASDGALAEVIKYLQGTEWTELVKEVGKKPAVEEMIQYLTDAGLPVDFILAIINELIQSAKPSAKPDANGSLRPLLDEIEAAIPVEDLMNFLNDKKVNSADFAALYEKISSDRARQLVDEVRTLDEVQRLVSRLKDMGVRVNEALEAIYEWLGWRSP